MSLIATQAFHVSHLFGIVAGMLAIFIAPAEEDEYVGEVSLSR
jgi:hypothetical protein